MVLIRCMRFDSWCDLTSFILSRVVPNGTMVSGIVRVYDGQCDRCVLEPPRPCEVGPKFNGGDGLMTGKDNSEFNGYIVMSSWI